MMLRGVRLLLRTPACLSETPALGNEVFSSGYIPGSTVRGALAGCYLASGRSAESEEFRRFFGPGGVRFSNFYLDISRPLSLSAFTCKRFPGFRNDTSALLAPPHGVVDLLFEADSNANERRCEHEQCGHALVDHELRFYTGPAHDLKSHPTSRALRMRTSVTQSGAPREGALFVQSEIPAGEQFQGTLASDDGRAAELIKLFNGRIAGFIGKRRSGKADFDFDSFNRPVETPELHAWQSKEKRWAAMTFASDAILIDRLLRPITCIDNQTLHCALGLPTAITVEVENSFATWRKVAGWSGVGKMFKPDDIAISMGSTALLHFKDGDEDEITQWMQGLAQNGAGLRREEGFGQITFSAPLHMAMFENQQPGIAL